MSESEGKWKIWIDTGGTFTDCIAFDPAGNRFTIKVLSSSALRGKILGQENERVLKIDHGWKVRKDIFQGYRLKLLHRDHNAVVVEEVDLEKGRLILDQPLGMAGIAGADFEITGGEEAPLLAARIVTGTALYETLPPLDMRLGSTRGTNTLLERKGARVAFIVTQGFADILRIGTQRRPDIFALHIKTPETFCAQVIEVQERISAGGGIILPLEEKETKRIISIVRQGNVEAVAICLLHSYLNNGHEQKLAAALREAGIPFVSRSSSLAPVIGFLARARTAVINAYLSPVIEGYLSGIKRQLQQGTLQVMTSAGGMAGREYYTPKDSLLSGPAGGVAGAAWIGALSGITRLITFDMGGTSTDAARYEGDFDYKYEIQVGTATLISPAVAIETVAAGGGSRCSFDGIKFRVGPDSAGAFPGPACYGAGGPLTITDINLLLGRLYPGNFGIPVHKSLAEKALDQVLEKAGKPAAKEEVLAGFLNIANERMADTIRKISVAKGYDVSEYALLAFGGAGGQHACAVAELLSVRKIIIPYDGSLLSAYGMGNARIERFAVKQVLKPLSEVVALLDTILREVAEEGIRKLAEEGFAREAIEIRLQVCNMRLAGQEVSLEIMYRKGQDLEKAFKEKYTNLYGHWIEGRTIELESVKAVASTKQRVKEMKMPSPETYSPSPGRWLDSYDEGWRKIPVYQWDELNPGAFLCGPALVINPYSTLVVGRNWSFTLDPYHNGLLDYHEPSGKAVLSGHQPEMIQLELFINRFRSVAEGMGALLERTAFSINIRERMDFSCALLDARGELVVNAPHIPVHLGSLGICVRSIVKAHPLAEGDVIISNHPAFGGSHLPDITLISAVFTEGVLTGYVAVRAHHAEIGGKKPGSMPADGVNLAEEGVLIPPAYLIKKGETHWEEIENLLTSGPFPTRMPEENLADLRASLASVHFGRQALQELTATHGLHKVQYYMERLKEYASAALKKSLQQLKKDRYGARELLDDGTVLQADIRKDSDRLYIDFTGSGPVHPGNLNATPAIVNSVVMYVLRLLIGKFSDEKIARNLPLNEGFMQAVQVHIPEGILHPAFPPDPSECPAVGGGNTETSQRLTDTLLKAFGFVACSQGTMNNLLFGNAGFGYYETIGGGVGAGETFNGASAVHQHMTNTKITDPEVLEFRYPVRLERFAVRKQSGGEGRFFGGDGIIREITFLERVELTLLSQHRMIAPYGMAGGKAGKRGRQYVVRASGITEIMAGIDERRMDPGDRMVMMTPGGGGYGRPPRS